MSVDDRTDRMEALLADAVAAGARQASSPTEVVAIRRALTARRVAGTAQG
jgi:hypothetical protein